MFILFLGKPLDEMWIVAVRECPKKARFAYGEPRGHRAFWVAALVFDRQSHPSRSLPLKLGSGRVPQRWIQEFDPGVGGDIGRIG